MNAVASSSPLWRRSRPLVFVDDLDSPVLDDADFHHLQKSLRLDLGAEISLSDGAGRWRAASLAAQPVPLGEIVTENPEPSPVTIAFTPVKGQKAEWVLQKLTELGVQHIVPLITERSVVRWDEQRSAKQLGRWPRIIREAAMQSRQVHLPTFEPPKHFADYVAARPDGVLADPAGPLIGPGDRSLMIGPEGGWSDEERECRRTVSLPGGVLRAETASVVGATMLVALRSGYTKTLN